MGAATKEEKTRTKTFYTVLQHVQLDHSADGVQLDAWQVLGQAEGVNDIDAIRDATAQVGVEEGEFVAIPARSFRVRAIKVETQRRLRIQ